MSVGLDFRAVHKGSVVAEVTISDSSWMIRALLLTGTNGPFVSLPSEKYTDKEGKTKYKSLVRVNEASKEDRSRFNKLQTWILNEAEKLGILKATGIIEHPPSDNHIPF